MFMFHMGSWNSFELTMVEADILCGKEEEQGGSSDRYADMYGYRLDLSQNPFLFPCCPGGERTEDTQRKRDENGVIMEVFFVSLFSFNNLCMDFVFYPISFKYFNSGSSLRILYNILSS